MSEQSKPTQDKKNKRFEIRLSDETYNTLEDCSKILKISKSKVIHKGIELVRKTLK